MATRGCGGARARALRLLALCLCVQAASATIAYDIEKPWKLWTSHAVHAMLTGAPMDGALQLPRSA